MPPNLKPIPPDVFLIVDHLDAVLGTAELLAAMSIALPAEQRSDGAAGPGAGLKAFVDRARTLELSIMSRALQARARARALRAPHPRIKLLLNLFIGGTAPLADAIAELADPRGGDFDSGDCPLSYLRSRGLIAPDRGSLHGLVQLAIGDEFLVAKRIALGPLMDLAAQFLDTLGVCYDLFRNDAPPTGRSDDRDDRDALSSGEDTHTTRA